MTDDPTYRKLYETSKLTVGHSYEYAYLTKRSIFNFKKTTMIGWFIYDPTCALISYDNSWCLVGGDRLLLWTPKQTFEIDDDNLKSIEAFRQIDLYTVHILIDPWADNSAIWEFNIQTKQRKKLRDFNDYKDQEYTDDIKW